MYHCFKGLYCLHHQGDESHPEDSHLHRNNIIIIPNPTFSSKIKPRPVFGSVTFISCHPLAETMFFCAAFISCFVFDLPKPTSLGSESRTISYGLWPLFIYFLVDRNKSILTTFLPSLVSELQKSPSPGFEPSTGLGGGGVGSPF
jgi:hypothetical protein